MTAEKRLEALQSLEKERARYNGALMVMYYDLETAAPPAAAEEIADVTAFLSEKTYTLLVNDETAALLEEIRANAAEHDAPTLRRAELLQRELDSIRRIPMDEYTAFQRLTSEAQARWMEAKQTDRYALFEPYLKQIVEYSRRFAAYKNPDVPVYDALLDDYEKGMTMAALDPFFDALRETLPPLLERLQPIPPLPAFLSAPCPVSDQRRLAEELMQLMGLDRRRCALGETEHPFTTGSSRNNVRITTHYHEDAFISSLYSVIHEGGHALYELDIPGEMAGTCLGTAPSMSLHESQSRFFENLVGHDPGFLHFLAPRLRAAFPGALNGVSDQQLVRAVNDVRPSLIRTEADEVTYPLHIMVRYELEKRLLSGDVTTRDLPAAWNEMYREYLGITVPNDRMGVLQDTHWSSGFGYFPTYALGSAYASQMMHAMRKELDVDALLSRGELQPITEWLCSHVHCHGSLYEPLELVRRATGEDFNPKYYTDHLTAVVERLL